MMDRIKVTETAKAAFWSKVDTSGTGCWLWGGDVNKHGYGWTKVTGLPPSAHRTAYLLANGPLIPGRCVHHCCLTPGCCRPDHLQQLTPREHRQVHTFDVRHRLIMRRPVTADRPAAHFGIEGYRSHFRAERAVNGWRRMYPDFTEHTITAYLPMPAPMRLEKLEQNA